MSGSSKAVRVYLSHGPYLDAEVGVVRRVVREWNASGGGAEVRLIPDEGTGAAPSLRLLEGADVFVLLLSDRWRSSLGAGAARDAEAEYECARGLLERGVGGERSVRLSHLAVFAREGAAPEVAALQEQQVSAFKRAAREDARVVFREFTSLEVLERSLGAWLRGLCAAWALESGPEETDPLREAIGLANAGMLARAEAAFMLAVAKADSVRAFIEYGKYLRRRGRAPEAKEMLDRAVARARATNDGRREAEALANLAMTLHAMGRLEEAEATHARALALADALGDGASRAGALGGLARIDKARGDFVTSYRRAKESLALSRKLGDRSGEAAQCANLGLLHRRCGQFERAEKWLRRALAIDEELGRDEALARDLGNLALVHKARGEHEIAERLLARAAEINTRLGCLEGLANDYANLGQVCGERGNVGQARRYHEASREIEERLGRDEGLARSHHSLGLICFGTGDPLGAGRHWECAAALFERAGLARDGALVRGMISALTAGLDPVHDGPALAGF